MEETIKDKKVEKKELHLKKYKINKIDNKLSIIVNGKPTEVGLIPNKLIDANSNDNRKNCNVLQ
jgi:ABC-2 type transport system permease protein